VDVLFVVLFVALFLGIVACILGIPGYMIAQRSGVRNPGVAFIPMLGFWIVMFETIRRSGWFACLALVPQVGIFIVSIWTAIEVPQRHGRSQWWTAALIVPLLNIFGYWAYALTLRNERELTLFATA
jgi:hypothetical protein